VETRNETVSGAVVGGPTLLVENRSASHLSTGIDRYSPAFKRFSAGGQKLVQAHHGRRSFSFAASDAAVEEAQLSSGR
jgi:hypothetical protein